MPAHLLTEHNLMEFLTIQLHCAINSNISVSTFSGIKLFRVLYGKNQFFYGQLLSAI